MNCSEQQTNEVLVWLLSGIKYQVLKDHAGNELTNKFLLQPQDTSEDTYQIGDAVVDEATFHVTLDSVTSAGGGASNTDR